MLCELAIVACDLAEVIGTAIALNLLFGIPLLLGLCLTALDVMLILLLQRRGFRYLEAFVLSLFVIIIGCFSLQMALAEPDLAALMDGFVFDPAIVSCQWAAESPHFWACKIPHFGGRGDQPLV